MDLRQDYHGDTYVFIENVGQIFVNGLTLKNLEKKLFRMLQKVYSSLNNFEP